MPVYNCAAFVQQAVQSILDQTLTAIELIIIDDNSTDATKQIIANIKDSRIVLVEKKQKTGLVDSLNTGLLMARGKYIARMDGDDISNVVRLQKQVDFLERNTDVDWCGSAYQLMDSKSVICHPLEHEDIKLAMLTLCPFGHPTIMFRKSFIEAHDLRYSGEFDCAEDYELWTRGIWLGKAANLPDVLLYYREHSNQSSNVNSYNQAKNSALCKIKMLNKVWDNAGPDDKYTMELLFEKELFKSQEELNDMLLWIDDIEACNSKARCFEPSKLGQYLSAKKSRVIRKFYLHQTRYNPAVLYKYLTAGKQFRSAFNKLERLKLTIKCLLFWSNRWQAINN